MGQVSTNVALNGQIIPINILYFGDKVLKLVSLLFVGVYLPEYYMDWFAQSTTIRNLILEYNT